jgi:hypothetical protein
MKKLNLNISFDHKVIYLAPERTGTRTIGFSPRPWGCFPVSVEVL